LEIGKLGMTCLRKPKPINGCKANVIRRRRRRRRRRRSG
jgi:hypothetical protein